MKARIGALALALVGACKSGGEPGKADAEVLPSGPCVEYPRGQVSLARKAPRDFSKADAALEEGRTLAASGNWPGALDAFDRAVRADPTYGLAHLAKAEAHLYVDNDQKVMRKHLAKALLLLPENPRAHLSYAQVSAELDQPEVAKRHWRCALDLEPTMEAAHYQLARHYLDAGEPKAAEAEISAALENGGDDYRYHVLRGDALEALGRPEDAAEALQTAAEQVGRSAPLFRRAAALFEAAGKDSAAERARARADAIDPPPEKRRLRKLPKARRRRRR